ncbi:MAG TPA: hypothetical protein VI981_03460 [Candidatus Paceibacterota bacterium]
MNKTVRPNNSEVPEEKPTAAALWTNMTVPERLGCLEYVPDTLFELQAVEERHDRMTELANRAFYTLSPSLRQSLERPDSVLFVH